MEKSSKARGFSIIELAVTALILLLMVAISAPTVTRSLRSYQLTSATTQVANILQRTRYEAIRLNTTLNCRAQQQADNSWIVWIDLDKDGNMGNTEPMIQLPVEIQFLPAGVAPAPDSMGFPNAKVPAGAMAFDSRGTVSFAGAPAVYVVYLGFQQQPGYGYRAVTLTPLGKTKTWRATASGTWHSL